MWSLSVNYLPNSTWRSFTAAGCFMWGVSAKVLGQESMCNHIGNKINMVAIMLFHSYTNHGVECQQALLDLDRFFCLKECFCDGSGTCCCRSHSMWIWLRLVFITHKMKLCREFFLLFFAVYKSSLTCLSCIVLTGNQEGSANFRHRDQST